MRRNWFLWLCMAFAFVIASGCEKNADQLPIFGQMPDFELIDHHGQKFNAQQLKGKVWVGNFIFTSCGMTCPALTKKMKGVEREIIDMLGGSSRLAEAAIISFSVDPERDTPERLRDYMKTHGCDERVWTFLTGPLQQVTHVVVQGFKIGMGKVPLEASPKVDEGEIFEIVHGEKFILVDRAGQIRGYYNADRGGLKRLIQDFKALMNQTRAST